MILGRASGAGQGRPDKLPARALLGALGGADRRHGAGHAGGGAARGKPWATHRRGAVRPQARAQARSVALHVRLEGSSLLRSCLETLCGDLATPKWSFVRAVPLPDLRCHCDSLTALMHDRGCPGLGHPQPKSTALCACDQHRTLRLPVVTPAKTVRYQVCESLWYLWCTIGMLRPNFLSELRLHIVICQGNVLCQQGRRPEGRSVARPDWRGPDLPWNMAYGGGSGGRLRSRSHLQAVRTGSLHRFCSRCGHSN